MVGAAEAFGRVVATDDNADVLMLSAPAERIVSLAPSITELLFTAGAGEHVVGAVEYSDYPPAARSIPRIGNYGELNLEAVLALRPDLVAAWGSGSPAPQVRRLRELGIPVYVIEPRRLLDIADHIDNLGRLAGAEGIAARAAKTFRWRLRRLHETYARRTEIEVFYQVWHEPLTTVNGQHLISKVIRLCGGRNVFARLLTLAPRINIEAVLVRDPDVIIAGGAGATRPEWLDAWKQYPELQAVQARHLYFIDPDLIQRHSPRILDGAEIMCERLERVRKSDRW
jgi:iron complex transport system substrate-binding protein